MFFCTPPAFCLFYPSPVYPSQIFFAAPPHIVFSTPLRHTPSIFFATPTPAFCFLYPSLAYSPLPSFSSHPTPHLSFLPLSGIPPQFFSRPPSCILPSLPVSGILPLPFIFFRKPPPPHIVYLTPLRHTPLKFFRDYPLPHFVILIPLRHIPPQFVFAPLPRILSSLSLFGIAPPPSQNGIN